MPASGVSSNAATVCLATAVVAVMALPANAVGLQRHQGILLQGASSRRGMTVSFELIADVHNINPCDAVRRDIDAETWSHAAGFWPKR